VSARQKSHTVPRRPTNLCPPTAPGNRFIGIYEERFAAAGALISLRTRLVLLLVLVLILVLVLVLIFVLVLEPVPIEVVLVV
jgi:uncharacterized membrane protein